VTAHRTGRRAPDPHPPAPIIIALPPMQITLIGPRDDNDIDVGVIIGCTDPTAHLAE
jgi:hypothetical protein